MEENKTIVILKMLTRLSGRYRISYQELSDEFGISLRTFYRYLQDMESAGFLLDRHESACRLHRDYQKQVYSLFHLTDEEAQVLVKLIETIDVENKDADKLLKKLDIIYDIRKLNKLPFSSYEAIEKLKESMQKKMVVKLVNYRSSHSNEVSDRLVEPFQFISEYEGVWCLDQKDKICKQFKLHRIDKVELLPSRFLYENLHELPFEDIFHMSGKKAMDTIDLEMSLTAANLLKEDFPGSKKVLTETKKKPNNFRLTVPIANYHGVGRFVLGLPGEIRVLGSPGFIGFLEEKKNSYMKL